MQKPGRGALGFTSRYKIENTIHPGEAGVIEWVEPRDMIKRLAEIFRGFSLVFGISAPPPGQDERQFVMLWLGIISVTILFFVAVLFAISHFHVG